MVQGKDKAPLYEALVAHARLQVNAFHVPGHKQRAAWEDEHAASYYRDLLALDVTELPTTDDLHYPEGPLAEAQELAAACYGAEETRFLVGGSTAGNLAMIVGVCEPGDLLIVQRNVHKSIIHGLMLAGVRAVLLPPDVDPVSGLATVPGTQLLQKTLEQYPEAKAVILSAPNYYGMSPDLRPLIAIIHEYGLPVLIDEAHGPHYGFHPSFPESSLQSGADLVVQSTHKMLSAMTMGAMLHMQGDRISRPWIRQALTMVQSSSPSFPIMASLDLARKQLHTQGKLAFDIGLQAVKQAVEALSQTSFRAIGYGDYASKGISYDPFKLVLFDERGTMTGFELRDELFKRNCVAEMADSRYVVMAFGTGSTWVDGERLRVALTDIESSCRILHSKASEKHASSATASSNMLPIQVPDPVRFGRNHYVSQAVPLTRSAGLIAAEWVIPYPPGIPVLYPGETITEDIIKQLQHWKHEGAQIQGASDISLESIQVEPQ